GDLLVVDSENHRIQKFRSDGTHLATFGGTGSGANGDGAGAGDFHDPHGIAIDAAGAIYVVDTANHRIQKLGPSGDFIAAWGEQGFANGNFELPTGIAVHDTAGTLYIADRGNNRIQMLTLHGAYRGQWTAA